MKGGSFEIIEIPIILLNQLFGKIDVATVLDGFRINISHPHFESNVVQGGIMVSFIRSA